MTTNKTTNQEVIESTENFDVATIGGAVSPSVFEQAAGAIFSTIKQDGSRATAIKQYNAISDAENSLSDFTNTEIVVEHMVAHPIELLDEVTGELIQAMRVVLLTPEGVGYHSVSTGVVSSLQRIIGIVGQGPWTAEPLTVVPVEKKTRKGFKTLTLKLV